MIPREEERGERGEEKSELGSWRTRTCRALRARRSGIDLARPGNGPFFVVYCVIIRLCEIPRTVSASLPRLPQSAAGSPQVRIRRIASVVELGGGMSQLFSPAAGRSASTQPGGATPETRRPNGAGVSNWQPPVLTSDLIPSNFRPLSVAAATLTLKLRSKGVQSPIDTLKRPSWQLARHDALVFV